MLLAPGSYTHYNVFPPAALSCRLCARNLLSPWFAHVYYSAFSTAPLSCLPRARNLLSPWFSYTHYNVFPPATLSCPPRVRNPLSPWFPCTHYNVFPSAPLSSPPRERNRLVLVSHMHIIMHSGLPHYYVLRVLEIPLALVCIHIIMYSLSRYQ